MSRPQPFFERRTAWTIGLVTWVLGGLLLWDDHRRRR